MRALVEPRAHVAGAGPRRRARTWRAACLCERSMRTWTAIAALAVGAACASSRADAPKREAPEPPPSKRFERDMMVRLHMHESFDLLRAIERLLIRGRLDEAKVFAAAIAEAPDEPGLGPWTRQAIAVRERAAALARATTIAEACQRDPVLAHGLNTQGGEVVNPVVAAGLAEARAAAAG